MNADQARMEFAPPPTPGLVRAVALAIVAHLLLLAVLSFGVQWKRDPTPVTVEAELWSALPVKAAPRAPDPTPQPRPPDPVKPPVVKEVVLPPPPTPVAPDPSIAIAKEKAKQKEKQRELDRERMEFEKLADKRLKDAELKAQKLKDEKEARETAQREKLARDKKQQLEEQKAQTAKSEADAKKVAELRKLQMERMSRMANQTAGSGDETSTGSAKQSSGPSAGYAGKIVARIKSNTNFSDSTAGSPSVKVLVQVAPTGNILSTKVLTPSGNSVWDEAVLRGIEKMNTVPPDVDGQIPNKIIREGLLLTVTL